MRSDPPRPSVATLPSGARPMKPGTTGTVPREPAGLEQRAGPATAVSGMSGVAPPWRLIGADESSASTNLARRRADGDGGGEERRGQLLAAADHRVARARLEVPQHADGAAQLVELGGRNDRFRPAARGGAGAPSPPALPRSMAAPKRLGGLLRGLEPPRRRIRGGVEQQIGDAAERRRDDRERALVRGDARRRTLDGIRRRRATRRRTSNFEFPSCRHLLLSQEKPRRHEDSNSSRLLVPCGHFTPRFPSAALPRRQIVRQTPYRRDAASS